MARITNIEAYDMANKELINTALDLVYKVGELDSPEDIFDYAASMSAILTEIKWRAIMDKFQIRAAYLEQ